MEEDFQRQETIKLDSKSFQFSKIILALQLPMEAFDDESQEEQEEEISNYFTEQRL